MTQLRTRDLLDSLGDEHEDIGDKKIELARNPTLEAIIRCFEIVVPDKGNFRNELRHVNRDLLSEHEIRASDIEAFSLLLRQYEQRIGLPSYEVGSYLSSLIERCLDSEVIIHTGHLETPIDYLGRDNDGKSIRIKGDAGSYLGSGMISGTIIVEGNASFGAGWGMKGGTLIIEGDGGNNLARNMVGGEIHLKGNMDFHLGEDMIGGTIYVNGNYKHIAENIRGGNIYHKGRPVVLNGKRIRWYNRWLHGGTL